MSLHKGVVCGKGFELVKGSVSVLAAENLPLSSYLVGGSGERKAS